MPELKLLYWATADAFSVIITTGFIPARWPWYHTAALYTHLVHTHTHNYIV